MLKVENLIGGYMNCPIINGIDLEIQKGEFFALLGPNGSGKSTLFKLVTGQIPAMDGNIRLCGKDITSFSKLEKAKKLAVLTQEVQVSFDYTIEEIVSLGRYPHQKGLLKQLSKSDWNIIEEAMEITNILHYRKTPFRMISGGEKQRVLLAKALVQEPEILLLDEPTNHLDIKHTLQMLDLLKERQRTRGLTVFAILHDLNIASLYADRVALLHKGSFLEVGDVDTLRKVHQLQEVYEVELQSQSHPTLPKPQLLMTPNDSSSDDWVRFEDSYTIEQTNELLHIEFNQPLRTISNGLIGDGIQWLKHFCHFHADKNAVNAKLSNVDLKYHFEKHAIPHELTFGIETLSEFEDAVILRELIEGVPMLVVATVGNQADESLIAGVPPSDSSTSYNSINIMIFVNANLTDGALITALMAITEAKLKAVQELEHEVSMNDSTEETSGTDSILLGVTQQGKKISGSRMSSNILKSISHLTYIAVQESLVKVNRRRHEEKASLSQRIFC